MTLPHFPITIQGETASIGTANELAITLDVLQGQYDTEVLTQLRPHLAGIVADAPGFMTVMRSLQPLDQLLLIEAIGPDLASVLQDARHLRDQLATMAHIEVEEALLRALGGPGLRRLLMTAEDLGETLEWVYDQCDVLALDLIGEEHLRDLCRRASDLAVILRSLDPALQDRLVEQLGWPFITALVQDGPDLAYLLRALPPAASQRLLEHYTPAQLRRLIGNAQDWTYLYQRLEPAEADYLTQRLAQAA